MFKKFKSIKELTTNGDILISRSGELFKIKLPSGKKLDPKGYRVISSNEGEIVFVELSLDQETVLLKPADISEIQPIMSNEGYLFFVGAPNLTSNVEFIEKNTNRRLKGVPVHRMVVYSYGDCNGLPYIKSMHVDHIDQDKTNNHISNLEQVSEPVNLARAVRKTNYGNVQMQRLHTYLSKLDQYSREIALEEIRLDMRKNHG